MRRAMLIGRIFPPPSHVMNARVGRSIYAAAIVAFGAISLGWGEVLLGLEPIPATFPGRLAIAYLSGVILVLTGAAMLFGRSVRLAAIVLASVFTLWLLVLHAPGLATHPTSGSRWTVASELWALAGITWVLAAQYSRDEHSGTQNATLLRAGMIGRIAAGIALLVFGALHFVYSELVATIVPAWYPQRLFLTYVVGVAFCAAGLSVLSCVKMQLATTMLGIMFAIMVVTLHIPRALTTGGQNEWTSLVIAIAMCGGAWVLAGERPREAVP